MANMNIDDPAKQEAIRRGPHEYVASAGKHGAYIPKPHKHQEYPKMMGKFPMPDRTKFKGQPNGEDAYAAAMLEWDRAMTGSIVNSKAEELQWLKANG